MTEEKKELPEGWRFFPHWVMVLSVLMMLVMAAVGTLATLYPVPDDAPEVIPYPDDGENIPGPEWLFLLFWLPFWYYKGSMKKYLIITTLIPMGVMLWLFLMPYYHKIPFHKVPGLKSLILWGRGLSTGFVKSFLFAIPAMALGVIFFASVVKSGHQAKVLGCDSCHNPAMGPRMAIPPVDVAQYYDVERAMQIDVGKYRAGKSSGVDESGAQIYGGGGGEVEGYKDADWQMRHMYEPTFTW
ncbi:MAG: hypothetical protein OEV92_04135 [Nitrospinota bacterium]|nr:hypothetical protein [Nitrospinota bacterium]